MERRRHNRVININDTGLDLEKAIRDNIKLHCDDNLYANYQSRAQEAGAVALRVRGGDLRHQGRQVLS